MIDIDELHVALRDVDRRMKGHGGGIELVAASDDGAVEVRFTGMCQGCFARPTTFEGTIRPRLMSVAGVVDVTARGTRISDEAALRLRGLLREEGGPVERQ
jgi:Fe-S cluster biogenesis protein NfuA